MPSIVRFSGLASDASNTFTLINLCLRLRLEKLGAGRSIPAIDKMLATIPVVCQEEPERNIRRQAE